MLYNLSASGIKMKNIHQSAKAVQPPLVERTGGKAPGNDVERPAVRIWKKRRKSYASAGPSSFSRLAHVNRCPALYTLAFMTVFFSIVLSE